VERRRRGRLSSFSVAGDGDTVAVCAHPQERREVKKRKLALTALTLGAAALVVAGGVSAKSHAKTAAFKAAWIYVGPHNDGGWSQAHDQGRLAVQKALGSKVQTTF
jgi:hypothetical protein